MKLRLLNDSIRLRLSRSDVATAAERGAVAGHTQFPNGHVFTYVLEVVSYGVRAGANYSEECLSVRLPSAEIMAWANDAEAVSLRSELQLPGGDTLDILVEKDFTCLTHRPDEDQSDLFVNTETGKWVQFYYGFNPGFF
jgi:hypothetical protein